MMIIDFKGTLTRVRILEKNNHIRGNKKFRIMGEIFYSNKRVIVMNDHY